MHASTLDSYKTYVGKIEQHLENIFIIYEQVVTWIQAKRKLFYLFLFFFHFCLGGGGWEDIYKNYLTMTDFLWVFFDIHLGGIFSFFLVANLFLMLFLLFLFFFFLLPSRYTCAGNMWFPWCRSVVQHFSFSI